MKAFIGCLLFAVLFGIIFSLSLAQQNQDTQKPDSEIETLKKGISELQNQLQTVGNEKIELTAKLLDAQAKLADANAKLINAEFGKLERELRDSNQKWLIGWIIFFLTVLAVVGTPLWLLLKSGVNRIITNLKSNADQLITDEVEKSLNGFEAAVDQVDTLKDELKVAMAQVNILQDQIRILEREHAASVLENFMNTTFNGFTYPQSIEALGEETLLQVFGDEKYRLPIREKAVEVLAHRKSPQLVSPVLEFLNSIVDSNFDWQTSIVGERLPFHFLSFVGQIYTDEAHQGLEKFLNRLLTENPKHKHLFLPWTAFFLADISVELKIADSVSVMKQVISNLEDPERMPQILDRLVEYFDTFNESEGIKEILTNGLTDMMPEVETRCLELLEKRDPKFVNKWRAQKTDANTQNKESS